MTICDICTGFHASIQCATAQRYIVECLTIPAPTDFCSEGDLGNIVQLATWRKPPMQHVAATA